VSRGSLGKGERKHKTKSAQTPDRFPRAEAEKTEEKRGSVKMGGTRERGQELTAEAKRHGSQEHTSRRGNGRTLYPGGKRTSPRSKKEKLADSASGHRCHSPKKGRSRSKSRDERPAV